MLESIEPSKVAYLIGYLSGDGNFCGGYGKRVDRLSVTTTDVDFVDWLNGNIIEFNTDHPKMNDNKERGIIAQTPSYTKIFPAHFESSFLEYGILSLKEGRVIKNISRENMQHWLRGLLDSDGCITYSFRKGRDGNSRLVGKVVFTHPSEQMLLQMKDFLKSELDIESAIADKKGENCKTLSFSKLSDMKKFGDYIYQDKGAIVLRRKYDKFVEFSATLMGRVLTGDAFPDEFKKSEANHKLLGSFSKYMFIAPDGTEYASIEQVQKDHPDVKRCAVHNRCSQGYSGWSRRLKTDEEKLAYKAYVKKETKLLFQQWLKENKAFYGGGVSVRENK